jgi:N,N'-diacetyllegionaminate synthase
MVYAAKDSGADVAKFQYWNPKKLRPGSWDDDGRREIYEKAFLTPEKINFLQEVCSEAEIKFMVSAFNAGDAAELRDLGIDTLKIPSHEVANTALHEYASENFSQCYVSLGAGTWEEVCAAADIYNQGISDWSAMHCVSSYPCPVSEANIAKIASLKDLHNKVGYSDHTQCVITPALTVALGCSVIEKHFTSDNELPGRDNKFALNPHQFSEMVKNIRIAEQAVEDKGKGASHLEQDTINNYRGRWGS